MRSRLIRSLHSTAPHLLLFPALCRSSSVGQGGAARSAHCPAANFAASAAHQPPQIGRPAALILSRSSGTMNAAESSSSADAPRKRALSPAALRSADAVAASLSQSPLLSTTAPQPPKRARNDTLPAAFSADVDARASAGPAASVAPRWFDLSPAQRCFSDGLALAFSFLSLFELIPAALTCRSWRDVAVQVDVPGVELRNPLILPGSQEARSSRLQSLASSPFRRHVHALTHSDASTKRPSLRPSWDLPELRKLKRLPQLRRISGMSIELFSLRGQLSTAQATQPFTFPPLLGSVDLHLSSDPTELDEDEDEDDWDWSTESVQRLVLGALRPCHSLTQLSITMHVFSELVLDGLLELPTLQILELTVDIDVKHSGEDDHAEARFSEAQIAVVKQLPNLRRLTLRESRRGQQQEDLFMNGYRAGSARCRTDCSSWRSSTSAVCVFVRSTSSCCTSDCACPL